MVHLIVATHNSHKTREFREILGTTFALTDLSDYPEIQLPPETGATFEANAALKAVNVSQHCADIVIGDDSGLEVEALEGAPGVFSARYAGDRANDRENVQKLLNELARVDPKAQQRQARFRCILAIARDGHVLGTFTGTVDGLIANTPRGSAGFGYDPVFVPNGYDETFAELPPSTKNRLSHRARAVEAAKPFLKAALQQ